MERWQIGSWAVPGQPWLASPWCVSFTFLSCFSQGTSSFHLEKPHSEGKWQLVPGMQTCPLCWHGQDTCWSFVNKSSVFRIPHPVLVVLLVADFSAIDKCIWWVEAAQPYGVTGTGRKAKEMRSGLTPFNHSRSQKWDQVSLPEPWVPANCKFMMQSTPWQVCPESPRQKYRHPFFLL